MTDNHIIHQIEEAKRELSQIYKDLTTKTTEDIKDIWVTKDTDTYIELILKVSDYLDDIIGKLSILKDNLMANQDNRQ